MSLEDMRALLRTYTPGRRVRFKPEAQAVRDKAPPGVESGMIIQILPLPIPLPDPGQLAASSADLLRDPLQMAAFGLEIEIEGPDGPDAVVLGTDDVILDPLDLAELRDDLWHRMVRFARSTGIGIAFPAGAADDGIIEHVRYRREEDGRQTDLVVSLRIAVDPDKNPAGINTFYTEADFTQCQLRRRMPPAKR